MGVHRGLIFTIIGVVFTPIVFVHNYHMNESVWLSLVVILGITVPFIVVGVLFMMSHYKKKKVPSATA